MDKNNLIYFIAIFGAIIFLNFQCDKEDPCPHQETNITTFGVNLSPNEKSILLNDTIWLETNFDALVALTNRNESLNIGGASCFYGIRVMKVTKNTVDAVSGFHDFEYINENGKVSQDTFIGHVSPAAGYEGNIEFTCQELNCISRKGLVSKKRGTFCISLSGGRFDRSFPIEEECPPSEKFQGITFLVDDFHRELYDELNISLLRFPQNGGGSASIKVDNNDSAYIFQVK